MKRRTFIHQLTHAAAMPALFSSFGINPLNLSSYSLLSNTLQEGNILIILLLNGGNDGLNMVIPLNMKSNLHAVRPQVVLPDNKILSLGTNDLGLHPSMSFFKSLHDENRLKIVHSVGYQNPSYSHFRSMDIWQTGSESNQYLTSGWIGRYLENRHPEFPEAYPSDSYPHPLALEMGWNSSLQFTGNRSFTSIVSSNPDNFYEIINEFNNEYPSTNVGEKLKYLQLMAKQSNSYGEVLKEAYNKGELSGIDFPRSNLADQFKIIAKLISGGLNTRIYKVEIGGFDTHGNQVDTNDHSKGEHANLLGQINDAVQAFMQVMDAQKKSDRILGMTLTEFGRTVHSNGTNGTDHGTVSPMLFFGNKLDTNVLGTNPVIPSSIEGQFDLERQFDYRQMYQAVINQWLGGTSTTSTDVLYKDFENVQIIAKDYADLDGDGVGDIYDLCNDTAAGALVDFNGCEIFTLPADNYQIHTKSLSCINSNNGEMTIRAIDTTYEYTIAISVIDKIATLNQENEYKITFSDLEVGTYHISITIDEKPNYNQIFDIKIVEPAPLEAAALVDLTAKTATLHLSGSEQYTITLNGVSQEIYSQEIKLELSSGVNRLQVRTPLSCQGVFEKEVFVSEKVVFYPNPIEDELYLLLPGSDATTQISIYNEQGIELFNKELSIPLSRTVKLQTEAFTNGLFIVHAKGKTIDKTFKVIKQ